MAKKRNDDGRPRRVFCVESGKEKDCFSSESKAKSYARHLSQSFGNMTPYFCITCACWHLTHHSAKASASIQRHKIKERRAADAASEIYDELEF